MNIIKQNTTETPQVLTVADMKPGMVYRVWSPFDGSKRDSGTGQVCLKLTNGEAPVLLATHVNGLVDRVHLTITTEPYFCGHPSVCVAEVYGKLTGVEVAPI